MPNQIVIRQDELTFGAVSLLPETWKLYHSPCNYITKAKTICCRKELLYSKPLWNQQCTT